MLRPKIQFSNFNCVGESIDMIKRESKLLYDLLACCEEYMNEIEKDEKEDSDLPHYIYEATMEYVYGSDVWNWINEDHHKSIFKVYNEDGSIDSILEMKDLVKGMIVSNDDWSTKKYRVLSDPYIDNRFPNNGLIVDVEELISPKLRADKNGILN